MRKKEKKEKVVYYDDGSTIADMSCVESSRKKYTTISNIDNGYKPLSGFKEKATTFLEVFKMMLIPCAIVLGLLMILYFVLFFIG